MELMGGRPGFTKLHEGKYVANVYKNKKKSDAIKQMHVLGGKKIKHYLFPLILIFYRCDYNRGLKTLFLG